MNEQARILLDRLKAEQGPVSRWDLLDSIKPGSGKDGLVREYINRIRKAYGQDAIRNVFGKGYVLTEAGRQRAA